MRDLGPHWTGLRNQVEDVFLRVHNGQEDEVYETTRAHFDALRNAHERQEELVAAARDTHSSMSDSSDESSESSEEDPRAIQEVQVRMAMDFLDRAGNPPIGSRPSARIAVLFIARADYNLQLALDNYEDALDAEEEEVMADQAAVEAEREPVEEQEQGGQQQVPGSQDGVDRVPALINNPQPSKFSITIPGSGKTRVYPHVANFDWSSSEQIRALNRWRTQYHLYAYFPLPPSSPLPTISN